MTKEKLNDGVYIVASGLAAGYNNSGHKTTDIQYSATIQLTANTNFALPPRQDKLLSLVQSKLLNKHFVENQDKYSHIIRWRTCAIDDVFTIVDGKRTDEAVDVDFEEVDVDFDKLTKKKLVQFCIENGLNTDPTKFGTVQAARRAVSDEWDNKLSSEEIVLSNAEKEAKKRKENLAEFAEVLEFNNID